MGDMYTILINEDHSFIHTKKKRIMQRSNVDAIRFLVNPQYNDLDMTTASAVIEIRMPVSHTYVPITLTQSAELYKDRVEFILPLDLKLTKEAGDLEFTIKFAYLGMVEGGVFEERVRTIGQTYITIDEVTNWSDYIPSADMENIVQIMLANQSIAKDLEEIAALLEIEKADGIKYDSTTNIISLTSNNAEIASTIVEDCECGEGIPVVEFSVIEPETPDNEMDNVVQF